MYIRADKYNSNSNILAVEYLQNAFLGYATEPMRLEYWVYAHWVEANDRDSTKIGIYFGRTRNIHTRWDRHVYDAKRKKKDKYFPFQMAINKHGPDVFRHACIPALSWEHAGNMEKFCISRARKDCNLDVYNVADGGRGIQLSAEIIAKRVISFKRTISTPESKERRKAARKASNEKRKVSLQTGQASKKIGPLFPGRRVLDHIAKTIQSQDYLEMVRLAKSGSSISSLAKKYHLSEDTVTRRLTWTNVYVRKSHKGIKPPRFNSDAYRQKIMETDLYKTVLELHACGCSYAEVSRQVGIPADRARNWVRWIFPTKLTRSANKSGKKLKCKNPISPVF